MDMSYKRLEATLLAHFQINPDKASTFKSRIKQLQRLGFPPGVNIGRGAKMEYSATHLFKLVTALELISAGIPADRATKIVSSDWETFAAGFAVAIRELSRQEVPERIFAWVLTRSFGDLQIEPYTLRDRKSDPLESRVVIADEHFTQKQLLERIDRRRCYAYTLLPLTDLAANILVKAEDVGGCENIRNDQEFKDWIPKGARFVGGQQYISYLHIYGEETPFEKANRHCTTASILRHGLIKNTIADTYAGIARQKDAEDHQTFSAWVKTIVKELSYEQQMAIMEGPESEHGKDPAIIDSLLTLSIMVRVTDGSLIMSMLGSAVQDALRAIEKSRAEVDEWATKLAALEQDPLDVVEVEDGDD